MNKKELEEILAKHAKSTDYKLEVIANDIGMIKEGMVNLQDDVTGLKSDVAVLKEDVGGLKDDVGVLKEDVAVLKEDVSGLKGEMTNLTEKVDVIFEQTGKITVDMVTVKDSVQSHEQKIQQL